MAYLDARHHPAPAAAATHAGAHALASRLGRVIVNSFEARSAYRKLCNTTDAQLAHEGLDRADAVRIIGERYM